MFGRLLAACIVVGLVLYALQIVARGVARRGATAMPGGRIVAVLETTALPNAASLHVIRVAERYLLVARSASQIAMLCEIPGEQVMAAHAVPSGRSPSASGNGAFARLLSLWLSSSRFSFLRRLGRP